MSEQVADARVGTLSEKQAAVRTLSDEPRRIGRFYTGEWLIRHRRSIAAVVSGFLLAACTQRVAGEAQPEASTNPVIGQVPVATAVPFPCERGGKLAQSSEDKHVHIEALNGYTIAPLFGAQPNDVEQCNTPTFPPNTMPNVASAVEFRQLSTGDRVVVAVRTDIVDPQETRRISTMTRETELVNWPSSQFFEYSVKDDSGARTYIGATMWENSTKPGNVKLYSAAIDRPVAPGSTQLYEVDAIMLNNPQTDDDLAAHTSLSTLANQLGNWIDGRVVTIPTE